MADDDAPHGAIDWGSASVKDATLTVRIAGDPGDEWAARLQDMVERLDRPGSPWGTVEVEGGRVSVKSLSPGCEADLRHLLDGAVQQANADFAAEDKADGDDGEESGEDREMAEAFRSFADGDEDEDEDEAG